jgi:signal transduction histidine kinase
VNRVYDFLRRHPTWVDGFWGLVLLVPTTVWLVAGPSEEIGSRPVGAVAAVLLATVITLRRRAPEAMLLLAIGTGLLQLVGDARPMPVNFAFLVIIFTVATRTVRWASRLALIGALLAPTISGLRWPYREEGEVVSIALQVVNVVLITVCFALAWVLGDSLRTRRAYYAELEERAARLERERATQSRMAVVAERARIARELHDVVAHNVSVMVVQADGAAYVLDTAPEQARTALQTISVTGRQALTEMRRLLGVLRDGGTPADPGDYVPQPGLEQLGDLIDQVRDTGLPVDFHSEGTPRPLPSGVELTAYRIVQEALTNTRKHGGPGAVAHVRLGYGGEVLTVLAEDDGRGAQAALYAERGAAGRGHGLIGMRERVGMVGGRLETGPRPGGGFRIRATLPLKGECPQDAPPGGPASAPGPGSSSRTAA